MTVNVSVASQEINSMDYVPFWTIGYVLILLVAIFRKVSGHQETWRELIVPTLMWLGFVFYFGFIP